jgi:hypothetical protein
MRLLNNTAGTSATCFNYLACNKAKINTIYQSVYVACERLQQENVTFVRFSYSNRSQVTPALLSPSMKTAVSFLEVTADDVRLT